jgi:hypothetical protein
VFYEMDDAEHSPARPRRVEAAKWSKTARISLF